MNRISILMLAATGGWVASGSAATIYNESIGGDLSGVPGSPSILTSTTDTVLGTLDSITDRDDHFIISNLVPSGTAQFDFSASGGDPTIVGIRFLFRNPATDVVLFSADYLTASPSGTTGDITVPASGQVKVTVQNIFSNEGGTSLMTWTASTNDVVPETSTAALAALGALLAMRRNRR